MREICVTVASEVLAVVIRQLTIRSTTLTIGAGSGWFTFGAGLVIALILDYIWDWWSDPTGELATKLEGELTQLEKLIIEGTGNEGGLQARLGQLSQERASARERAIMALLKKQKQ
ncbi:hypothetical protein HRbin36_01627 [bacterium HR36]|nr:hypothetical protein HRbin36_01627 [bacterium HR36]